MTSPRTDLAVEMREIDKERRGSGEEAGGVSVSEKSIGAVSITYVEVSDKNGEKAIGKPIGKYITIEPESIQYADEDERDDCIKILSDCICELAGNAKMKSVLIVGLGNRMITADALGPKTVDKIFVTRHLKQSMPSLSEKIECSVCAIAPGVLGITGMETAEIVKGLVRYAKPDMVICVDALAAREIKRLNQTIQLSNTGICPGSGVGNHRSALDFETLGVPVLSIGVPTVIDAVTMTYDAAMKIFEDLNIGSESAVAKIKKASPSDLYSMIEAVIQPSVGKLTVTPKEVDSAIERISSIVAGGINLALQKNLTMDEINSLLI